MSYQALARKWRPKSFDQVVGQSHVVSALANGLDSQRVHHAFLFTGTRGVGKTTLARIFAKALNCEKGVSSTPCGECVACRGVDDGNFVDLIEVDAASRTKVDDTRELLDNVQYTPAQGQFKIYLIDEVHMLSTHSFNALLKTLEEPPPHIKFLLATTDPQKLPTTILSRCIQFNLKIVDIGALTAQLEKILKAEGIEYDAEALLILARSANGSVRDALSLLDQGIAFGNGEVRSEKIRVMLGMISEDFILKLLHQIIAEQTTEALQTIADMAERAVDFAVAVDAVLSALHNISLYQVSPQAVEWKGIDSAPLSALAERADAELLQLLYQIALIGKRDLELAADPRSGFEMVVLRMLAFHPAKAGQGAPPQTPPNSTSNSTPNAAAKTPPPTANPSPAGESPNPPTAPPPAPTANPAPPSSDLTLAQLAERDNWARWVESSALKGMVLELMRNMVPESAADNALRLTLDGSCRILYNDARKQKIERHLAQQFAQSITLHVTIAEDGASATEQTPSKQQQRSQAAAQQATQQAFRDDPKVQDMVSAFNGEIVAGSIKQSNIEPEIAATTT